LSRNFAEIYKSDACYFNVLWPNCCELIDSNLPKSKTKLVEAWIELRREDLMAEWQLAVNGQRIFPIDPLK
jgi:Domain of unknown function (DUF4160)